MVFLQIVVAWVKRVAWQRRLPKQDIAASSATLLTYGSYGLGDAKVLLMRFEFDGISINLPFVQLKVLVVLENLDILNPVFLRDIDETGWKSLSRVLANTRICRIVPDLKKFQSMLRCVKFWAKRRGVYGNLNGLLGGIHLAILAAFVCQCDPYPWPRPVELQDGMLHPTLNPTETRLYMPIRLPFSPYEYCHSNITKSTFYKIRTEFLRGHNLTKDEFGDWVGWIKSCFRCLLIKLEEVQGLCDPNPVEYIDVNIVDPHVIFYWGLQAGKTNAIDIKSVKDVFWKNINTEYQGPFGK
ncbi:hypothetical protein V6Z12_D02G074300 [Gossypium hirsutum]